MKIPAAGLIMVTSLLTAPLTQAQAVSPSGATVVFNIDRQPIGDAINAFAAQTGLQVLMRVESIPHELTAPKVTGSLTPEAALKQLLQGTGLEYEYLDPGTVAIRPAKGQDKNTSAGADAGQPGSSGMRLARVEEESRTSGSEENDRERRAGEQGKGIPEILVKGSRSQNVDIERSEDDAMPYVTFDAKDIESSGATSLEEFFRKRLPMNTQQGAANQPIDGTPGNLNLQSNVSAINLRGLGVAQTLILIDGRRAPRLLGIASGDLVPFTQADINGIPLSSIERIEILPSTAGGIYGGGATGGVINIIRKHAYNGFDAQVGYDGALRGGGETFRAEFSGGFSPDGGVTQIDFSASHQSSEPLYAGDNDLWRRARQRFYSLPSSQGTSPPPGYVTNIQAFPGFEIVPPGTPGADCSPGYCYITPIPDLTFTDGRPLNSSFTSVPVGYGGFATDNGQALLDNAGRYNLDLSNDGNGRYAVLRNGPRVHSATVNVRRAMGGQIDAFVDLSASENLGRSYSSPSMLTFLFAGDQNNPFQQDVFINVPVPGLRRPIVNRTLGFGANGGLIARLSGDWVAAAEYDWSRASTRLNGTVQILNTFGLPFGSLLNPVVDVNAHPIDYSAYLLPSPDLIVEPRVTEQRLASARVSGPVFAMTGGAVNLTALIEHRDELAQQSREINNGITSIKPPRRQSVSSAYAELRAPLVSDRNSLFLVRSLELQASARHDRYATRVATPTIYNAAASPAIAYDTTKIQSTDFTLAARWTPVRDLALRASYATGFLPPNITQLVSITSIVAPGTTVTRDVRRGGELIPAPYTNYGGGNPDLKPEDSRSFSTGAILTPGAVPGLRLSIDYSRIRKSDEIGTMSGSLDELETYFPGRVVRDTNPATFGVYGIGPILSIDNSLLNIANSRVRAWDFQTDYDFTVAAGEFHFYAIATRLAEFERQLLPTVSAVSTLGFSGGPLKWRGNAGVDWSRGSWNLGWNAQYYHRYSVRYSSRADDPSNDGAVFAQGSETIPSQIYHDLNLRYRFAGSTALVLHGVELTAGIQNIFDAHPPVLASNSAVATYSLYGDPRLRRYTLSLLKHF